MTREQKITKLNEVKEQLKNSFVGLNDIIDNIISTISPWYVTPEILNRPIVVSLWGMTGTGKTSIVKKLIELLSLKDKSIFFDCGRESDSNGESSLVEKISELGGEYEEFSIEMPKDMVFVFDEFQYARSILEDGTEIIKPYLRPVWNIIDDGELSVHESRYSTNWLIGFIEDSTNFIDELGGKQIKLDKGNLVDPSDIETLENSSLGYFYFNTSTRLPESCSSDDEVVPNKKIYNIDNAFRFDSKRLIYRKLNQVSPGFGEKTLNNISSAKTFNEVIDILKEIKKHLITPKILDLSKSLVFVLGNLDEAFREHNNLDHDGDADTFANITSQVTVTKIKEALKTRFRAEQIARLGNNLIKYPTLRKSHFEEIIKIETGRVLGEFKATTGIDVRLGKSIYELIYSEGVCPTQGVRPVFTTIGMILTPILSDVIILNPNKEEVLLEVDQDSIKASYRVDSCKILIKISNKEVGEKIINLQLGALRKPKNRKTRFICSVHEVGHAIMKAWCTGKTPTKIISVDSSGGGICYIYDKDRDNEISTRQDILNNIMISLGGYTAEEVIYGRDSEQLLLGSGNDIEEAYEIASNAIYNLGFYGPYKYADSQVTNRGDGIPAGIDNRGVTTTVRQVDGGIKSYVKSSIEVLMAELRRQTTVILEGEKKLLANTSIKLAESGVMNGKEFEEFISKFGSIQLVEQMNKAIDTQSYQWYENRLKECLE